MIAIISIFFALGTLSTDDMSSCPVHYYYLAIIVAASWASNLYCTLTISRNRMTVLVYPTLKFITIVRQWETIASTSGPSCHATSFEVQQVPPAFLNLLHTYILLVSPNLYVAIWWLYYNTRISPSLWIWSLFCIHFFVVRPINKF